MHLGESLSVLGHHPAGNESRAKHAYNFTYLLFNDWVNITLCNIGLTVGLSQSFIYCRISRRDRSQWKLKHFPDLNILKIVSLITLSESFTSPCLLLYPKRLKRALPRSEKNLCPDAWKTSWVCMFSFPFLRTLLVGGIFSLIGFKMKSVMTSQITFPLLLEWLLCYSGVKWVRPGKRCCVWPG